jgi:hypothetical protein
MQCDTGYVLSSDNRCVSDGSAEREQQLRANEEARGVKTEISPVIGPENKRQGQVTNQRAYQKGLSDAGYNSESLRGYTGH